MTEEARFHLPTIADLKAAMARNLSRFLQTENPEIAEHFLNDVKLCDCVQNTNGTVTCVIQNGSRPAVTAPLQRVDTQWEFIIETDKIDDTLPMQMNSVSQSNQRAQVGLV